MHIYLYSADGVTCSYRVGNVKVIDLTQMFGAGNEPTIEEFEAMFPASYYPYNAGELLSVEGLQSHDMVGFNQWDEEWVNGTWNTNGTISTSRNASCKNPKGFQNTLTIPLWVIPH